MGDTRRDWKLNLKIHILSIDAFKLSDRGKILWRRWQKCLGRILVSIVSHRLVMCYNKGWRFFHLLLGGQYKQTCSSAQTVGSSSQSSGRCWRLRYECWEWRWTACTWPGLASACWTGSVDVRRSRKNDTSTHNGGSGLYEAYLLYYFFVSRKDEKIDHKTVGLKVSKLAVK